MVFYRRGEYLTIDLEKQEENLEYQKLVDDAVEQYYFIAKKILVVRHSKSIKFFKYDQTWD